MEQSVGYFAKHRLQSPVKFTLRLHLTDRVPTRGRWGTMTGRYPAAPIKGSPEFLIDVADLRRAQIAPRASGSPEDRDQR